MSDLDRPPRPVWTTRDGIHQVGIVVYDDRPLWIVTGPDGIKGFRTPHDMLVEAGIDAFDDLVEIDRAHGIGYPRGRT